MANSIPCQRCDREPVAHVLLTDQTPDFSILGKPTQGLCMGCLAELVHEKMQEAIAVQQTVMEMEASGELVRNEAGELVLSDATQSVGTEAGVLERVEADEGAARVAPSSARPKRRPKKVATVPATEATEKAEATDVNV